MRAKRVTGPSAQAIMLTHIRLERCKSEGCENAPVVTKNYTGVKKERFCMDHIAPKVETKPKPANIRSLLMFGWEANV